MIEAGPMLWTAKRHARIGETFGFQLFERLNIGTSLTCPLPSPLRRAAAQRADHDRHLDVSLPAGDWVLAGFDLTMLAFGLVFGAMTWKLARAEPRHHGLISPFPEREVASAIPDSVGQSPGSG
jgi:hypothetical protein